MIFPNIITKRLESQMLREVKEKTKVKGGMGTEKRWWKEWLLSRPSQTIIIWSSNFRFRWTKENERKAKKKNKLFRAKKTERKTGGQGGDGRIHTCSSLLSRFFFPFLFRKELTRGSGVSQALWEDFEPNSQRHDPRHWTGALASPSLVASSSVPSDLFFFLLGDWKMMSWVLPSLVQGMIRIFLKSDGWMDGRMVWKGHDQGDLLVLLVPQSRHRSADAFIHHFVISSFLSPSFPFPLRLRNTKQIIIINNHHFSTERRREGRKE